MRRVFLGLDQQVVAVAVVFVVGLAFQPFLYVGFFLLLVMILMELRRIRAALLMLDQDRRRD
ncbi:MAG: hypothetical protein ACYDAY_00845 [Candidatus Dormibacteria bacterium]